MSKSIQQILDEERAKSKLSTTPVRSLKQSLALSGRSQPEHQKRMKENNPMKGKVSPNKGKSMPQISEKIKGKKKPEGFGETISKLKKGVPNLKLKGVKRPEHSDMMRDPERNKGAEVLRQPWICEHCGKDGVGLTNYVRWHGDNCKHK